MYNLNTVLLSNIIYSDQSLIVGTISVYTILNVVLDIGTRYAYNTI